jgi:hypothetical protein
MFQSAINAGTLTTYTYTGTPYSFCESPQPGLYPCSGGVPAMSISFTTNLSGAQLDNLVFDPALDTPPMQGDLNASITAFTITDGIGLSVTQLNQDSGFTVFNVGTDSNGNITSWFISAQTLSLPPSTTFYAASSASGGVDESDTESLPSETLAGQGSTIAAGTWTCTVSTDGVTSPCNAVNSPVGSSVPEPGSLVPIGIALIAFINTRRKCSGDSR